ncbi:MAG: DNA mismatch repair endonuclease MutL, partial [bacterium]
MKNAHKIQILPPDLSNKIAAGEVVERPASVVKELVENAIDAGANEITMILQKGGTELIKVVDNGAGIDKDDLLLAFERHATSKIKSAADLEAIRSLGFRGEALASIASVSRAEVKSVPRSETVGAQLLLDGGKAIDEKPAGGVGGTSIAIKSLFFNTPARRKFLKADSTEYRYCLIAANRFALSYPGIQFTLVHNGVVIWEVKAESLEDRIYAIVGNRLKGKLIEVDDDAGAVQINGFVGTQDTVRRNSGEQYLFLNGRFITDRSLNHAMISGYGEILAHGGYPLYVLNLTIDPTRVDVNVHPTKMQVKFADDRLIYSLLRGAVKRSLRSANVIPEFDRREVDTWPGGSEQAISAESIDSADFPPNHQQSRTLPSAGDFFPAHLRKQTETRQMRFDMPSRREDDSWLAEKPLQALEEERQSSRSAPAAYWQFHNKYIISQTENGIVIIDQHAAHERVLSERALQMFEKSEPASQNLLFPVMV